MFKKKSKKYLHNLKSRDKKDTIIYIGKVGTFPNISCNSPGYCLLQNIYYEGCLEIIETFSIILLKKNKPLKFHQNGK